MITWPFFPYVPVAEPELLSVAVGSVGMILKGGRHAWAPRAQYVSL